MSASDSTRRRSAPRTSTAVLAFVIVALLGAAGLALAAANEPRTTAFSLDVPPNASVATLKPGQRACDGPITAGGPFGGVRVWTGAVGASGTSLRVSVTPAAGTGTLASGSFSRAASPGGIVATGVTLSRSVAGGTQVSLCLRNSGRGLVQLIGSSPNQGSGRLSVDGGKPEASATAMVLLRPRSISLLSELPTVFRRAALFRPNWVGAWTFWVLMVLGLPVAVGLMAFALGRAVREDADSEA